MISLGWSVAGAGENANIELSWMTISAGWVTISAGWLTISSVLVIISIVWVTISTGWPTDQYHKIGVTYSKSTT